ncbi:hypothetical protein [Herbidospora daliensis]|uniref:hypothetical protein n=1 Tax=Herbidospora daliensis TaxID=295585 RepID=UPI000785DF0A|nr:hypothetical protein [Herbidospora daliensis]
MSVEVTLICDACFTIINAAKTARAARDTANPDCKVGLPGGRDLCGVCANQPAPAVRTRTITAVRPSDRN